MYLVTYLRQQIIEAAVEAVEARPEVPEVKDPATGEVTQAFEPAVEAVEAKPAVTVLQPFKYGLEEREDVIIQNLRNSSVPVEYHKISGGGDTGPVYLTPVELEGTPERVTKEVVNLKVGDEVVGSAEV